MAQLIDTSVFITLERRRESVTSLDSGAIDEPVALAAITASELLAGVRRADTPQRRLRREAFVEGILELVPVLPMDLRVARVHAEIWSHLLSAGHAVGSHDMLIAATALAHGYSILTDNAREFERVSGLEVRRPAWA